MSHRRKKDKNYRRQIEVLKAQLSAEAVNKKDFSGGNKASSGAKDVAGTKDVVYTSVEDVKRDLVRTLFLTVISFSIIVAGYIIQRRIF